MALAAAGRGDDALPLVEEGRELHGRLPADLTRPGLSLLLFTEVVALGELGRIDAADAAVARSLSSRADAATTGWINMARARIDLVAGRPGAARATLEPSCAPRRPGTPPPSAGPWPSWRAPACSKATRRERPRISPGWHCSRRAPGGCSTATSTGRTPG